MPNLNPSPHPQPGDLIEISRSGFKHWAIYIGGGDVVHLTSDGASVAVSIGYSSSTDIAVVKKEPLARVTGNDRWCINNNSDRIWRPLPPAEIVKRAKSKIGKKINYKVLEANCEHFVNLVRYGKNISYQVIVSIGGSIGGFIGSCVFGALALPTAPVVAAGVVGVAAGIFIADHIYSRRH
ncbi:phospholipase A and acyltransferase 3-like [Hypanus sabinus]|uniref:phospholipase A and acyltransferase 3-like n=1 Tax=Hypanus sabinus TaxID=79690 RepID=UPI0028C39786|nr:phospholipase A and acyltransferase 3-like [Hypanus sabinus]XP_059810849.1 phospholipase A and acyltransferase 3-like [Hypanus sabinus]